MCPKPTRPAPAAASVLQADSRPPSHGHGPHRRHLLTGQDVPTRAWPVISLTIRGGQCTNPVPGPSRGDPRLRPLSDLPRLFSSYTLPFLPDLSQRFSQGGRGRRTSPRLHLVRDERYGTVCFFHHAQGEAEITSPPPRRTMRYGHEKQSTDGRGRRRSPRLHLAEPGPDRVQLRAKRRRRLRRLHLLDARAA